MTTNKTIPPVNGSGENKRDEILRLLCVMKLLKIKPIDIANKTGLSERTIKNCIWGNMPVSSKLLRAIHIHYEVSMDYIVSGNGSMFYNPVAYFSEEPAIYGDNPRTKHIISLINEWMSFADPYQQAWLETQMKLNMHLYTAVFLKHYKTQIVGIKGLEANTFHEHRVRFPPPPPIKSIGYKLLCSSGRQKEGDFEPLPVSL